MFYDIESDFKYCVICIVKRSITLRSFTSNHSYYLKNAALMSIYESYDSVKTLVLSVFCQQSAALTHLYTNSTRLLQHAIT